MRWRADHRKGELSRQLLQIDDAQVAVVNRFGLALVYK